MDWHKLPGEMVESLSLEVFKRIWMWVLGYGLGVMVMVLEE